MAVNYFAVTSDQARNLETKLTNAGAHPVHGAVVLARVARVRDQFVDGPDLDFQRCFGRPCKAPLLRTSTLRECRNVVHCENSFCAARQQSRGRLWLDDPVFLLHKPYEFVMEGQLVDGPS